MPLDRLKANKRKTRDRVNVRRRLIEFYGGKCNCCGEAQYKFLGLDHLLGGGGKERRIRSTEQTSRMILDGRLPKDQYQLLCHNCNLANGFYGLCPHKEL